MIRYIGIILLGFLVLYMYRIYTASQKLQYTDGQFKDFEVKNGVVSWTQEILITNLDFVPIPINGVGLISSIDKQAIGTVILQNYTVLNPVATTPVNFRIEIPIRGLGLPLLNAIKSGNIKMSLNGFVRVLFFNAPVNQVFNFKIPKFK
jgi:hypothetical protein